jgi:hypothetical protein
MAAQPTPQEGRRPRPAPAQPTGGPEQDRRSARRPPEPSGASAAQPAPRPTRLNLLFAIRTNWTPHLVAAGRWVVAAATGETGRRVARAVALTVVLAVLVSTLYDHGEAPRAAAATAAAAPAGPARHTPPGKDPGARGGLRGRDRATPVGERPAAVAADWYAARYGVARARVKPLQQDRLSAREVRVLVMADRGRGRLRTALVRVRKGPDGWRVR